MKNARISVTEKTRRRQGVALVELALVLALVSLLLGTPTDPFEVIDEYDEDDNLVPPSTIVPTGLEHLDADDAPDCDTIKSQKDGATSRLATAGSSPWTAWRSMSVSSSSSRRGATMPLVVKISVESNDD